MVLAAVPAGPCGSLRPADHRIMEPLVTPALFTGSMALCEPPAGTFTQPLICFTGVQEDAAMKLFTTAVASALAFSNALAFAQTAGAPSGRGSTIGDPAASTSGGSDANGDQGRDRMPDGNQGVRPNNKPAKM
jgi:hypothetical protein